MNDLKDKAILVTGESTGIGTAAARAFEPGVRASPRTGMSGVSVQNIDVNGGRYMP